MRSEFTQFSARPGWHLLAACLLLLAAPVQALTLAIGAGQLVRVEGEVGTVFVADPDIADIQVPTQGAVLVLGKRAGTTTLYALDPDGKQLLREAIVVRHNVTEMQDILRQRFPQLRLSLASAPGSVMVSGTVPNAETTEAIAQTLRPYLGEKDQLINRISISSPTQVYLKVRVTEMSKAIEQKLGVNWAGLTVRDGGLVAGLISGRSFLPSLRPDVGGLAGVPAASQGYSFLGGYVRDNGAIFGLIDVLDREGLITVLAEPNLTAVSGQTASFLAGGEFPVPVKQDKDTMSVEFKPFGVALDFTPHGVGG